MALPAAREDGFQPTVALLEALEAPPDGLIIASPANPTGSMIAPDTLRAVLAWCRAHGVRIVSDEIYHGITYGRAAETLCALDPDAVVINSFSKYYSMTGWRVGWMVVPDDLLRAVECLAQNLFISPPTLSQHAGLAVFGCRAALADNVRRYAENRAILLDGLPGCGFGPLAPADGAFYIYAGTEAFGGDSAGTRPRDSRERRRRGDAGHRLRSRGRRPVHPLFLCRITGRDARGGTPPRSLGASPELALRGFRNWR